MRPATWSPRRPAQGTDTVQSSISYTLGANVENLTLTGTATINATGNTLANTLTGNAGNNVLNGGAGNDTMAGGAGNDTYVVDEAGDVVTEAAGDGTDTVQSSVSYTLGANVENLTLTGTARHQRHRQHARQHAHRQRRQQRPRTAAPATTPWPAAPATTPMWSTTPATWSPKLPAQGTDTVQSSVSYTLGANVENLTLTGTAAINATGNTLNNTLTGNAGNNVLDGGAGNDTMTGGAGNDTYVVDAPATWSPRAAGHRHRHGAEQRQLHARRQRREPDADRRGDDQRHRQHARQHADRQCRRQRPQRRRRQRHHGRRRRQRHLCRRYDRRRGHRSSPAQGTDTVQSSVSYTLGANVENLTLTGTAAINGTGNTLDNTLTGNAGNNVLDGGAGNDTMAGGAGNDTYVVDCDRRRGHRSWPARAPTRSRAASATRSAPMSRTSTLTGTAHINGTGNTLDNTLTGNAGNNVLDGGAGTDTMAGGAGNDTYVVDRRRRGHESGRARHRHGPEQHQLHARRQCREPDADRHGAINATGNALDNTLTGNAGNNVLDGGAGTDTMTGGAGNDTYVVDDAGDVVTEVAGRRHRHGPEQRQLHARRQCREPDADRHARSTPPATRSTTR